MLGVSPRALWLDYLALSGNLNPDDIDAFLAGHEDVSDHERDVLVHSLNERFADRGQNHPLAWRPRPLTKSLTALEQLAGPTPPPPIGNRPPSARTPTRRPQTAETPPGSAWSSSPAPGSPTSAPWRRLGVPAHPLSRAAREGLVFRYLAVPKDVRWRGYARNRGPATDRERPPLRVEVLGVSWRRDTEAVSCPAPRSLGV